MQTNASGIRLRAVVPRCGDGRRHLLFITMSDEASMFILGEWGRSAMKEYPGLTSVAIEKKPWGEDEEVFKITLEGDIKPAKVAYRLVEWLSVAVRT